MNHKTITTNTALIFVIIGALGFASKGVFIKLAYGDHQRVDPVTLMTLRMLLSAPFYVIALVWLTGTGRGALQGVRMAPLIALGLTGYYLASWLDLTGLLYIPVGLERMILYLYPSMVVILSALFYRKTIGKAVWLALALSYAGIAIVFAASIGVGSNLALGGLLVFASAFAFSLFVIGSHAMMRNIGSVRFTALTMLVSSAAIVIHFALTQPLDAITTLEPAVYKLALVIAVFSTVLPSFLMAAGLRRLGSEQASIISGLGPIATLVMANWLLDEPITPLQLAGVALVIGGVWTISRRKAQTG